MRKTARKARKTRKSKNFETLTELAAALKSPITTVSGWTRHDLWKWSRSGPWSPAAVPKILRWAASNLERRGRPPKAKSANADFELPDPIADLREQKLRQEIRKLESHADAAETALARERGALHDAEECTNEAVRRATIYRNAVQNLPVQAVSFALSAGMPHGSAPDFQRQMEDLVNDCLRHTSDPNLSRTSGRKAAAATGRSTGDDEDGA